MLDSGLIDMLGSGLLSGGGAIFVSIFLLRRSIAELEEKLMKLEDRLTKNEEKTTDKFDQGEKHFQTMEIKLLEGINDIKLKLCAITTERDFVKELASELKKNVQ